MFGISGIALLWIKSYLSSRSFTVNAAGYTSNPQTVTCWVPQGSVLDPLLFILYTSPIQQTNFLILCRSPHSLQDALNHISSTITQISAWMTTNLLCLNPSKHNSSLLDSASN